MITGPTPRALRASCIQKEEGVSLVCILILQLLSVLVLVLVRELLPIRMIVWVNPRSQTQSTAGQLHIGRRGVPWDYYYCYNY